VLGLFVVDEEFYVGEQWCGIELVVFVELVECGGYEVFCLFIEVI